MPPDNSACVHNHILHPHPPCLLQAHGWQPSKVFSAKCERAPQLESRHCYPWRSLFEIGTQFHFPNYGSCVLYRGRGRRAKHLEGKLVRLDHCFQQLAQYRPDACLFLVRISDSTLLIVMEHHVGLQESLFWHTN
jgi:hypothetical protein